MAIFEDTKTFETCLVGFFRMLAEHETIKPKLLKSGLVIRFDYTEPDLSITVDCSKDPIEVLVNDTDKNPQVTMGMKADIAHKFWYGKVNLTAALARRQMTAKGPIPKILSLLPAIKPAYAIYPEYLREQGFEKYDVYS
jgi:putative sterol carrier protein